MVYFPRGHAIRVRNMQELRRLGFDRQPGLVDMDSGEEVAVAETEVSLRDMSERKIKRKTQDINPVLDDVKE
jgi:hypothetical protein